VNDVHYIAMEYVEGIDLARLVRDNGPLPLAQACNFIRQAALGLEHASGRGMVHRDIKPSNLLVTAPRAGSTGRRSLQVEDRSLASGPAETAARSGGQESPESMRAAGPPFWMSPAAVVKILDMGLARLTETTESDPVLSSLT